MKPAPFDYIRADAIEQICALLAEEDIECEWQERGLLMVHDDRRGFEAFAAKDAFLREEFGVGATPYEGAALQELEPALTSRCVGAWHYEDDCHVRPDKLLAGLRARLEARGLCDALFAHHLGVAARLAGQVTS